MERVKVIVVIGSFSLLTFFHPFSTGALPTYEPPPSTPMTGSVDLSRPAMKNALIAELFGTFILVQVGCGGLCVALYLGNMVRIV